MFGIVHARTPLTSSKIVGIRKVSLQWLLMTAPITSEPTTLPILPTIIEKQTAIALQKIGLV
jgi:hypothetical protein